MSRHRFAITGLAAVFALALACSRQSGAPTSPTSQSVVSSDAASDGSTLKAAPPVPLSPVNDQSAKDSPTLTAKPTAMTFDGSSAGLQYHFELYNDSNVKIADSGLLNATSFFIPTALGFKQRYTWRIRAESQGRVTAWSPLASFISFEGGYIRGDEAYDPLYNGVTIGERIGETSFVGDQGIRLDTNFSYVRYLIPETITSGEFSMEVTGLRADSPGDKSKVFGMSSDSGDFITDPYRFDVQYRGVAGSPPNAITFRALYGSAEDTSVRYEPPSDTRFNSVYLLDPNTVYFWKATWGTEVRVVVREGGVNGRNIYEIGVSSRKGTYNPRPHFAYLGTPPGRSGAESAGIAGATYRNVWISSRPRPQL